MSVKEIYKKQTGVHLLLSRLILLKQIKPDQSG